MQDTIYKQKTAEEGYKIKEEARLKALNLTAKTKARHYHIKPCI